MGPAEAQVLVDVLLTRTAPSSSAWGVQVLEYGRFERRADWPNVARALAMLYAEPSPTAVQRLMIQRLEDRLLPLVSAGVGEPLAALRLRVHAGLAAFKGEAPYRAEAELPLPAAPPVPASWEYLGAFRVLSGTVAIGETLDAPEVHVAEAANGAWFVWRAEDEPGVLGRLLGREPGARFIVSHESLGTPTSRHVSRARERFIHDVHGGRTAVADMEIREDARALSDFFYGEPVQPRGATLGLGGDGVAEWRGLMDAGRLVLLTIETDE